MGDGAVAQGAELSHRELTEKIIGCAIEVHRELGPGLLESSYEACLAHELGQAGLRFRRQLDLPIHYKGQSIDINYRPDIIVEEAVLVELKSVERLEALHSAQLMTYLKLSRMRVGLLINFNVAVLRHGLVRRVI